MTKIELGRLEKIDLKNAWKTEAGDFTPWLAQEENIQLLGETIGIDLEVEAQEKSVGPFRADILCKDTVTNHWVLIENQLTRTDHTHLGQLLTYAAGLNAVSIVWIAERFTDEHRAALDWLNEITDERFNFFGLEVELWQIGSSAIAPKFNVVGKPNDWTKSVSSAAGKIASGDLTPAKALQLEYWTSFSEYLLKNSKVIKPQKPLPQHWAYCAIGRSGVTLMALVNTTEKDKRIAVALSLMDEFAKSRFQSLHALKEEIESEAGEKLDWRENPGKKESSIWLKNPVDPSDKASWPMQHKWLKEKLELFHKIFAQRIKSL
jgi:hypothetical protein